jgi:hypothetical protein
LEKALVSDVPLLLLVPAVCVMPRQEGDAVGDGEGDAIPEIDLIVILALGAGVIHPI